MNRYRKKPNDVDAVQWDGENIIDIQEFIGDVSVSTRYVPGKTRHSTDKVLVIKLKDHVSFMVIRVNDWVLRDFRGEVKVLPDEMFKEEYEAQPTVINIINTPNEIREQGGFRPHGMPTWYEN